jgi:hypothetical protein
VLLPVVAAGMLVALALVGTGSASRIAPNRGVPDLRLATISIPTPYRYFWDANNDRTPDDGGVTVDAEGGGWNATSGNMLTNATNAWKDNTDFDPVRVT